MIVSIFSFLLFLYFLLLYFLILFINYSLNWTSFISLVYFSFLYCLSILIISLPTAINKYSPYFLPIFRNDVVKTTKKTKHTHTEHYFSLSSHSPSVLLSSCFLFLFPYSISITLFGVGKVVKDMSHFDQDVYCVLGCVLRPGEGWRWKVRLRVRTEAWRQRG